MKKLITALLALLVLAVIGCKKESTSEEEKEYVPVSAVGLNVRTYSMIPGDTYKLTYAILPTTATNQAVTWSSDNEAVATVSDDGTITAISEGTATITVTTVDGGKTFPCVVTVSSENNNDPDTDPDSDPDDPETDPDEHETDPNPEPDNGRYLKFTTVSGTNAIYLHHENGNNPNVECSEDGENWETWDGSDKEITETKALYVRGNNPEGFNHYQYVDPDADYSLNQITTFCAKTDAKVRCEGNVMSLIAYDEDALTIPCRNCFEELFNGFKSLVSAPRLPATTLAPYCYGTMFWGCESLTEVHELPATVMADGCYSLMFGHCSSLTCAPELPSTSLAFECYFDMFIKCESLTEAPKLPATSLANKCYAQMFEYCPSLTVAPELPATTLADDCYQFMFFGCTSLTKAPELPATTLANDCYYSMFGGCTNLNYVKMMALNIFDENGYSCLGYWLSQVSATGTFVKSASATWDEYGVIPDGWTVQTE